MLIVADKLFNGVLKNIRSRKTRELSQRIGQLRILEGYNDDLKEIEGESKTEYGFDEIATKYAIHSN